MLLGIEKMLMRNKTIRLKHSIRTSIEDIRSDRIIQGFYYTYIHPEKVGDRKLGWLIMSIDKEVNNAT